MGSFGIANASSIDEVVDASHKLYQNDKPVCSGTIVNTPKLTKQLFVTSAHCLMDLDSTENLLDKIAKLNKESFTIKKVTYNAAMEPVAERVYYLQLYQYLINPALDLALLEFKDTSVMLPAVDIATDEEQKQLRVGNDIAVIGFPLGFDVTVTKGQFSGKEKSSREPIEAVVFRYTAPSTYGNSGGGLYQVKGDDYRMIGIVSHVLDGTVGKGIPMGFINYAIPASNLTDVLTWVDNGGLVPQ